MRHTLTTVAVLLALTAPSAVFGFGTVRGAGQNAEHERITRHALGCGLFSDEAACFEPKSLQELAGGERDFGAIGIPDRGELVFQNSAHCDSGDWLDIPGYPHSQDQAEAALLGCRAWMKAKLDEAVTDAARFLDRSGRLDPDQVKASCLFVGQMKGKAKCNVIEDLGIMLHASQDFYSHTNWVDLPDPAQPVGPDNPPGLNKRGRAQFIDLRHDNPFPAGLLSGCFEKPPEPKHCNYGPGDSLHRVKHMVVNKDEGTIDPVIGAGTTVRGAHDDNFAHAIDAAIDDTRDKWLTLRQRLTQEYGAKTGALMACAISHDDPIANCPQ
ncbi:MAG: CinY protein [Alphaproteobacteria bacterium]|nr:CinY protein [Alphaproteobacteria bacterium]